MSKSRQSTISRKKKLAFATIIWLILVSVCEIGLRWGLAADLNERFRPQRFLESEPLWSSDSEEVDESTAGRFRSHPFLPYSGRPGISKSFTEDYQWKANVKTGFTNNSYGFRTREFPQAKEEGDFVVLCFGGSTTWGFAESNDKTWPGVLEDKLQERYPDRRIFVFNLAIDAGISPMSLVNYCLVGVHLNPDLVIVYHGVNDIYFGMGARDFKTDYSHALADVDPRRLNPQWRGLQAHLPNWVFHSAIASVATNWIDKRMGVHDLITEIHRDYPRDEENPLSGMKVFLQNLKTMAAIAEGHETQIIFSTFHWIDNEHPMTSEFNRRLREFFSHSGFRYVDQAELIPGWDYSIHIDEVHFTQLGRTMVAENFFKSIVDAELVEQRSD